MGGLIKPGAYETKVLGDSSLLKPEADVAPFNPGVTGSSGMLFVAPGGSLSGYNALTGITGSGLQVPLVLSSEASPLTIPTAADPTWSLENATPWIPEGVSSFFGSVFRQLVLDHPLAQALLGTGPAVASPATLLWTDETYVGFQSVRVTKTDDTKPWKPPVEVEVTKADGSKVTIDANTPFFTLTAADGRKFTVTAAAAGHIDALHIQGTDAGSKFDFPDLSSLFEAVSGKLSADPTPANGVWASSMDMGKPMGKEGLATFSELEGRKIVSTADIAAARSVKNTVVQLNKSGSMADKETFIGDFQKAYPDSKIQFQLVRGTVLVPVVKAPKQATNHLFLVFGPDGAGGKTLWTAAPGRFMPKHPDPAQHTGADGKLDEATFQESSDAWFETAMLVDAPQTSSCASNPKIETLVSAKVMTAQTAQEVEGFLANPKTKDAMEHGLGTANGSLSKDPVLAYNQLNAALLECRTIVGSQKMLGQSGELPANQKVFEYSEPDAKNPKKMVKRKIENDVPLFEGRIWELKRYPRKEYGEDNRKQALNYQKAVSGHIPGSPFKTATIQIAGNVNPDQITWMKQNTPDVEVLYTLRLPSGQDYVFALKPGSPDHPGLADKFPKPKNLTPQEQKIIRGIEHALKEREADGKTGRGIDQILSSKLLGFDPYEIKDLPTFQKFETDIQAKRWELFEKLGE